MDAFFVRVTSGASDPRPQDTSRSRSCSSSKKSKCGTKVTAKERSVQFPKETHEAGGKLFCTVCNIVLDHTRKSSVESHLSASKHSIKRKLAEKLQGNGPVKRQRVITEPSSPGPSGSGPSTIASQERNEICMEWVAMLAAANIPLSKTDHPAVRDFLHKRVINGGAIPHRKQLQECYLEREFSRFKEEVKQLIKDKPVSIITDEMSDVNGRFVLNILAAPLELRDGKVKTVLLDTVFLETTNHSSVAQAVVSCINDYEISFNNVIAVNTDNAAYMRKAYTAVFKGLFPNSVHITCLAHIMNLLGEAFKVPFKMVNKFVKNMNAIFWNAGARKSRFLRHMKRLNPSKHATMPPNPIGTRWNCWYDSVKYHLDHMDETKYKEFIENEMEHARSLAPNSLKELSQFFADDDDVHMLKTQMKFIVDKSEIFVDATDVFQSQNAMATSVWSMLQSIKNAFDDGGITMREMETYCTEDTTRAQKMLLTDIFNQSFALMEAKLQKYMTPEGQPGIEFLKHVQFFHPAKVMMVPPPSQLSGVPGLETVPEEEIRRYMKDLGPSALMSSPTQVIDLPCFWHSAFEEVPALIRCARRYIYATVSSADAERSFSLYNLVLSERRRNLSEGSLRQLFFLYFNNFVGKDFFE